MSKITSADSSFVFVSSPAQQEDFSDCLEGAQRVNLFALANMPPHEENRDCKLRKNAGRPFIPTIGAFVKNED